VAPGVWDGALLGVPHPVFDFGEGLLDPIEVGGVEPAPAKAGGGRNQSLAPAARMALRTAADLWLPRLSMMTMSPGRSVGTSCCST